MPQKFFVSLLVLLLFVPGPAAQGQEPPRATEVADTRILLETGAFDPLRGPQRLPSGLRLASEAATERWIVQFKAPLTREQKAALTKDFGLKLERYIPNLAYLERVSAENLRRLRLSPLVQGGGCLSAGVQDLAADRQSPIPNTGAAGPQRAPDPRRSLRRCGSAERRLRHARASRRHRPAGS